MTLITVQEDSESGLLLPKTSSSAKDKSRRLTVAAAALCFVLGATVAYSAPTATRGAPTAFDEEIV